MLAYLSVARLLGRRFYASLCRPLLLGAASVAFSLTFSLVEIWLRNPYTNDDLVLRAIACVVTPVYIAWICKAEGTGAALRRAGLGAGGVLRLVAAAAVALGLGAWAATHASATAGKGMPELLLARVALSFLAVAITRFRAVEIALCWAPHETKAPADEA